MPEPVYTPRLLKRLWRWLSHEPLAPGVAAGLEPAFVAHYAAPSPAPQFAWTNPDDGAVYRYDVSINQVERAGGTREQQTKLDGINRGLWKELPPALLEPVEDWWPLWVKALEMCRTSEMGFLLEQGIDPNRPLPDGTYPIQRTVAPWGGNIDALRMLVAAGAVFTLPGTDPESLMEDCSKWVASAGEAMNARNIGAYLEEQCGRPPGSLSGRV